MMPLFQIVSIAECFAPTKVNLATEASRCGEGGQANRPGRGSTALTTPYNYCVLKPVDDHPFHPAQRGVKLLYALQGPPE